MAKRMTPVSTALAGMPTSRIERRKLPSLKMSIISRQAACIDGTLSEPETCLGRSTKP